MFMMEIFIKSARPLENIMTSCIFCKIVKGEIPSTRVYEDGKVLAFLDIGPVSKGHTLVIPKNHYKTIMDIPDDVLKDLILVVKRVSGAVIDAIGAKGINVGINNHEAAGQSVPHAHFHVMPRHEADGLTLWPQGKYRHDEEMQEYAEKIRSRL